MSSLTSYVWGCLGGLVAALVVYVLPTLVNRQAILAVGGLVPKLTAQYFWMILGCVVILTMIAGVAPLLVDDVERGQAIVAGLGAQTIFKGIISTGQDAVRPPPPPPAA